MPPHHLKRRPIHFDTVNGRRYNLKVESRADLPPGAVNGARNAPGRGREKPRQVPHAVTQQLLPILDTMATTQGNTVRILSAPYW